MSTPAHHLTITTATPPAPAGNRPRCTVVGECGCGERFAGEPTLPASAQAQVAAIRRAHERHRDEVLR